MISSNKRQNKHFKWIQEQKTVLQYLRIVYDAVYSRLSIATRLNAKCIRLHVFVWCSARGGLVIVDVESIESTTLTGHSPISKHKH